MAAIFKGFSQRLWKPQLVVKRGKSKLNVTRPRLPHYERAMLEHICKPYFLVNKKPNHVPDFDICKPVKIEQDELNPFEVVLSKRALNWFQNSKVISFYQVNTFDPEDVFQNKVLFKKIGMKYIMVSKKVMRNTIKGTIYEPCDVLFQNYTGIGLAQNLDIQKLLQTANKLHKFVLLGAIIENKLLSFSELNYYGKIQNIEEARSKLVSVLNMACQNFIENINFHQNDLVQRLSRYQKNSKQ